MSSDSNYLVTGISFFVASTISMVNIVFTNDRLSSVFQRDFISAAKHLGENCCYWILQQEQYVLKNLTTTLAKSKCSNILYKGMDAADMGGNSSPQEATDNQSIITWVTVNTLASVFVSLCAAAFILNHFRKTKKLKWKAVAALSVNAISATQLITFVILHISLPSKATAVACRSMCLQGDPQLNDPFDLDSQFKPTISGDASSISIILALFSTQAVAYLIGIFSFFRGREGGPDKERLNEERLDEEAAILAKKLGVDDDDTHEAAHLNNSSTLYRKHNGVGAKEPLLQNSGSFPSLSSGFAAEHGNT